MIEIKKDLTRTVLLMDHITDEQYKSLADSVDLSDLTEFIKELNSAKWVPNCYWKNGGKDIFTKFRGGELHWVIYSYLTDRKLLIVEDQYYGYNSSRTEKYKSKSGYFNPLEGKLYQLVIDRLVDGAYLIAYPEKSQYYTRYDYSLGKSYDRENKLKKLFESNA